MNARVVARLNTFRGIQAIKRLGSVYGKASQPDVYGCIHGFMFQLEGKVGKNKQTQAQADEMKKWKDAGAIVGVFYSASEAVQIVMEGYKLKMIERNG